MPASLRRLTATAVLATATFGPASCGGPEDTRTIADFDESPCALVTDDVALQVVAAPYKDLAGARPSLKGSASSESGGDTLACTCSLEEDGADRRPGVPSPTSSDLWMKIGAGYYHLVVVPQPGFINPVAANVALSPIIVAVASAAAARMPKS